MLITCKVQEKEIPLQRKKKTTSKQHFKFSIMVINLKTTTNVIERTDTLARFYNDIKKYPVLTYEEEINLLKMIKKGDGKSKNEARELLIKSNQRFIIAVAKRFGTTDNILDLISEGNEGLSEAIEKFDLKKNVKFTTWAIYFIRRSINRYLMNYGSIVRKSNISKTYHVISQATNSFVQKYHRQPMANELKDYMNEKFNIKIKDSIDVLNAQITSIDYNPNSDEDDSSMGDILDFNSYSASHNNCEDTYNKDFNDILVKTILNVLTPREQKIMKMNFGIGYMRSYEVKEIAEELNLTTERIRQMKASCLKRLKKEYEKRITSLV